MVIWNLFTKYFSRDQYSVYHLLIDKFSFILGLNNVNKRHVIKLQDRTKMNNVILLIKKCLWATFLKCSSFHQENCVNKYEDTFQDAEKIVTITIYEIICISVFRPLYVWKQNIHIMFNHKIDRLIIKNDFCSFHI